MNTLNILIATAAIGITAYLMATLATRRALHRYGPELMSGPPGPMGATGPQGPQGEPGPAISCACPATETIPVTYVDPVTR